MKLETRNSKLETVAGERGPRGGRVYLCGPMTGLPELNFPAFHAAARRIRGIGLVCENPAEINPDPSMAWKEAMRRDLPVLCGCDVVAVLPDWQYSRGARLEVVVAMGLGMQIVDATTLRELRWVWFKLAWALLLRGLVRPYYRWKYRGRR